jgi:hypothetical protein
MGSALEWGSVAALVAVLYQASRLGGNWIDMKIKAREAERHPSGGCDAKTHETLDRIMSLLEKSAECNAEAAANLAQHVAIDNERHQESARYRDRIEEKINVLIRKAG